MRYRSQQQARNGERGVTMILVVIAMLAMLGLVALAIDVITLYAARSETQRAADAAALAAAKMLIDAGATSDPGNSGLQTAAQTLATQIAKDVAQQVSISGRQVQSTDVNVTYPNSGQPSFGINPTVAVKVTRPNLPTFFSRIWSRTALSVSATATAEGFNPSNSSSVGSGQSVPVIVRGVKPFLLPNCDPGAPGPGPSCGPAKTFFDVTTGQLTRAGQTPTGVIGEVFILQSNCGLGPGCVPGSPQAGQYYPAAIPGTQRRVLGDALEALISSRILSALTPRR